MTAAIFNDTLAVGTHVFQVSPRRQTNIAVDDLGSGGAATVEFTYDDRGKDTVLSGATFAADVAADEWTPGVIGRASQTLRGPVTAVKITVTVATMKVVINSAAKVRATLFPAAGQIHLGSKTPCAMDMAIAAVGRNPAHHGVGALAMSMLQSGTGRSGIKIGTGAASMNLTITADGTVPHHGNASMPITMAKAATGSNPVHHGVGSMPIIMGIAGTTPSVQIHHGNNIAMPMDMILAAGGSNPVHHGNGVLAAIMALSATGSNPVHHGIGALAMGMGIASLSDGPSAPIALPQQGNIVLRWDASTDDQVWIDNKNNHAGDGVDVVVFGQYGSGTTNSNKDYSGTSHGPKWRSSGINGLGSLDFDGSTDYMTCSPDPNDLNDGGDGNQTVVVIFRPGFTSGFRVLFNWGGGAGSFNPSMAFNGGLLRPGMNGFGGGSSIAHSLDQELACIMTDDGGDAQEYRYSHDGTVDTGSQGSTATPDPSLCTLGSQSASTSSLFDGLFGEVIAWSPALTSGEMDDLQAWVTDKWGMSWA